MNRLLLATLLGLSAEVAQAQSSLTFVPLPALPDGGRYGMSYCQDQNYFYMLAGGSPATAYTSDIFRYDPAANSWGTTFSTGQISPQRFGTAALFTSASGVSLLGTLNGATATTPVPTLQSVRVSDGVLSLNYANPLPGASAGVAAWNGLLYAYGGQLASGAYTDQLRVFNPATSAWTTLAPMPEAKTTYGAAVNGKIYAVGGYNGVLNSARVDAYDIASGQWQALGTLPTTVSNQAIAVQGEWLWLVGDFNVQSYLAAYNTRTGQLRTFTSNLPPRRNAAAAFRNNYLYVWGGNTASANSSTLADMWRADVSTLLAASSSARVPELRVYPNPSEAGQSTLALPPDAHHLEVLDALGRLVAAATLPAGAADWPLDLGTQPAGLYLVRVHTSQGRSASCRVAR